MSSERPWSKIESVPEGIEVETKISDHKGDRNEANLVKKGGLFFLPDMSMYVYYTPTHWRRKQ